MTTASFFRVAALVALLSVIGPAEAQSAGGSFRIRAHAIAGGGTRSVGGSFAVSGTVGQYDAGDQAGGTFRLRGGLLPQRIDDTVFRNGFEP